MKWQSQDSQSSPTAQSIALTTTLPFQAGSVATDVVVLEKRNKEKGASLGWAGRSLQLPSLNFLLI
jgi:hypothetical protein